MSSFKARFNTPCKICGANISPGDVAHFVKGDHGYWCGECEEKRAASQPQTAETPEAARQSSTLGWDVSKWIDRQIAMREGHEENMESARQMRSVLALLVTAVDQLRQAVVDMRLHLEGKR